MTVIAWDGKTLAADKMTVCGDMGSTVTKIFKPDNSEYILAICGEIAKGLVLVDWFINGQNKEDYPEFQSTDDWARLVCAKKGEILSFEADPIPITIEDDYHAWGTGRDYAMGAMYAGCTAEEAILAANKHSITCGCGVDAFKLE